MLSDLTAAPLTITAGGKEYTLSPLTLADMGEFERWAESQALDEARAEIKLRGEFGAVTDDEKKSIIGKALEEIKTGMAEARLSMQPKGLAMWLWLSLRHHHADLKLETVESDIGFADARQLQEKLDKISGLVSEDEKKPDPNAQAPV